jgi:hypothetical protein
VTLEARQDPRVSQGSQGCPATKAPKDPKARQVRATKDPKALLVNGETRGR